MCYQAICCEISGDPVKMVAMFNSTRNSTKFVCNFLFTKSIANEKNENRCIILNAICLLFHFIYFILSSFDFVAIIFIESASIVCGMEFLDYIFFFISFSLCIVSGTSPKIRDPIPLTKQIFHFITFNDNYSFHFFYLYIYSFIYKLITILFFVS